MNTQTFPHLFPVVSKKTKLAWHFTAGKLAAIKVHTPGAAEGKRGSASVRVQSLACARATAETEWMEAMTK